MQEPSLGDLLNSSIKSQLNNIYTAMPCTVVEVPNNLEDLRIHVQPSLNIKYKDGTSEERPVIFNVPVMMCGSSTTLISFPLHIGDTGLCIFSQRGLDTFKSGNGYPSTPTDYRKFDKRDAIFLPGLFPFAKSSNNPDIRKWSHNTDDLVIAHNIASANEVEIRLGKDGTLKINTEKDVTVNAKNAVVNTLENISMQAQGDINISAGGSIAMTSTNGTTWTGDVNHTGVFKSNDVGISTHKHNGGPSPDPGT